MKIRMIIWQIITSCILACVSCGCTVPDSKLAVMRPGQRITVSGGFGSMIITAGHQNVRYFMFSGEYDNEVWLESIVKARLEVIDNSVFQGLYCDSSVPNIGFVSGRGWGYSVIKMMEQNRAFESQAKFSEVYNNPGDFEAWNSDGLYVSCKPVKSDYWITLVKPYFIINVKQINIAGSKPDNLPGSQDDKIKVEYLSPEEMAEFEKSVVKWR